MSAKDEELAKQILEAYKDGQVDLTNVPELQNVVEEAVARASSTEEFHQKQELALQSERDWYHKEINRILKQQLEKIRPESLEKAVLKDLTNQRKRLRIQQETFEKVLDEQQERQKKLNIQAMFTFLANCLMCLLFFMFFLFVIRTLIYQGIWNGWGLHYLYSTVFNISSKHPYLAVFLGIIGFVLITVAIFASALLQVKTINYFTNLKAPKWLSKLFSRRRD